MEFSAAISAGIIPQSLQQPPAISASAIAEAQRLSATGNTQAAWEVLAAAGDSYADNAASILNSNVNQPLDGLFFRSVVEASWIAGGADLAKFDQVASDYQSLYLEHLGANDGIPPNSAQIENYYSSALIQNQLDPVAAIDNSLWAPLWTSMLGMESGRWTLNSTDIIPWYDNLGKC